MKTINSISGGRTSTYMAIHYPTDLNIFACVCIDFPKAKPKDPAILKYCLEKLNGNFIASAESVKTLKIMMQLEQKLGKEVVWVRGKSFDQIIDEAGCLPTWARRFCTTDLKILPIFEYVYFRYGVVKEQIGYRYDEAWRAYKKGDKTVIELINLFGDVQKVVAYRKKHYRKIDSIITDYAISQNTFGSKIHNREDILWAKKTYPMIDDRVERIHVNHFCNSNLPEFDFPEESNCAGCHHKSSMVIHNQYKEEPEIMEWFSLQEKKGKFNTWHDDVIPYDVKKNMNFSELLELGPSGSCDSGYCGFD